MQLYSTNQPLLRVPLKQAVMEGLPPDRGLYMPASIPALPTTFFQQLSEYTFPEIALKISHHLLGESLPFPRLKAMIEQAMDFDAPLVPLDSRKYVLELFHGPSLAFKDFGARFMAGLMGIFVEGADQPLNVLVATSGDTGGAVAMGFYRTPGIRVYILYPKGKVSPLQEKQLTTLGENITALEIDGTFDDCQALVKQAFVDSELRERLWLTSANSINIARLIPQSFYYFRAYQQIIASSSDPVVFSVPSGNFGNLTAGVMAWKMGLPIERILAATNQNDIVPTYLEKGIFEPKPSIATISNAMDVGNPSNFARMVDLFGGSWQGMQELITGYAFDNEATRAGIYTLFDQYGYLMDPHGAIGYLALDSFQQDNPHTQGVILETAHPAKFGEVVEPVIGQSVPIPPRLAALQDRHKSAIELGTEYGELKAFLWDKL